jgi:hypothetical protein
MCDHQASQANVKRHHRADIAVGPQFPETKQQTAAEVDAKKFSLMECQP